MVEIPCSITNDELCLVDPGLESHFIPLSEELLVYLVNSLQQFLFSLRQEMYSILGSRHP